jgi:hypothetical protein
MAAVAFAAIFGLLPPVWCQRVHTIHEKHGIVDSQLNTTLLQQHSKEIGEGVW